MDTLLAPLEIAVAWIMYGFHQGLSAIGLPPDSWWTWALSIVGLTVVIRIILIPLFVKQIHASRRMQLIKRTGTNPFSSGRPILLQSPIFFALFRGLNKLSAIAHGTHSPIGPIS